MYGYEDVTGNKVILIRGRCHCCNRREHLFTKRVKKFCFCINDISWYNGLSCIAVFTIIFGIMEFIAFNLIVYRGKPSAIQIYLIFPELACTILLELIFFFTLGLLLWIGVYNGNINYIKNYPWLLLFGYVFVICYIFEIARHGEDIVYALALSDAGMLIKSQPQKKRKVLMNERFIFYSMMSVLILAIILFITYMIILSLTWIDRLELELEETEE